jgi:hypothetical protein
MLAAALSSGCVGATGDSTSNGAGLMASPATVGFGNVSTGSSNTRSVTVTNSGAAPVSISKVSISGAGFSASGVPAGLILPAGGTAALSVTFAPSSVGQVNGSATVTETGVTTPLAITLSGNGVAAGAHSVTLNWNASSSSVAGYRTYRATAPGGPYTALNTTPNAQLRFTDSSVQPGTTYYYVVTAMTPSNTESSYSNQTSATVPKP